MIDLHLHLDGSLNVERVREMAKMAGVSLPSLDLEKLREKMAAERDCASLGEYLEKFELPLLLLQSEECIEYAVFGLLKDLKAEGLIYAEIRFAPQLHMKRGLTQDEVIRAAIRGLNRGRVELGMKAGLILCCMRSDNNREENIETVLVCEKYLGLGVVALDLAGNEAAYPTKDFADVFALAVERGIPAVIHAGEADGPNSIRQALELGASRIGHGIRAVFDEELMRELSERKIPLEICYSSNLQTKAVGKKEDYPLREFLKRGIAVTLNTDNLTVSSTCLKREYNLVKEDFSLSVSELIKIAKSSADAAFLPEAERRELKKIIEEELENWLCS